MFYCIGIRLAAASLHTLYLTENWWLLSFGSYNVGIPAYSSRVHGFRVGGSRYIPVFSWRAPAFPCWAPVLTCRWLRCWWYGNTWRLIHYFVFRLPGSATWYQLNRRFFLKISLGSPSESIIFVVVTLLKWPDFLVLIRLYGFNESSLFHPYCGANRCTHILGVSYLKLVIATRLCASWRLSRKRVLFIIGVTFASSCLLAPINMQLI